MTDRYPSWHRRAGYRLSSSGHVLAHKIAALDHLSRGRLMLIRNCDPGGTPSDFRDDGELTLEAMTARRRMVEIDRHDDRPLGFGRPVR